MENYKNPALSIPERVEDLMGRMTLREKVMQLTCAYGYGGQVNTAELTEGIGHVGMSNGTLTLEGNAELVNRVQKFLVEETRLGIPAIFHVETLNGGSLTEATTYPIPLGLAASFDEASVHEMGSQIRREMVAAGQKMALAPVLDISRDPRWGRMGETYGECPTLTAAMGTAYISGIQGELGPEGLAACAKHFVGYAASEGGLNMAGAHMGPRELQEVYLKPFAAAILEAWHPGELGGQAIADTLFGKQNPSGKLPVTAVRHAGQVPVYAEQNRGNGVSGRGRGNNNITQGYVDQPGFPLYPFGHGLSYTSFDVSELALSAREIPSDGTLTASCKVTNTGDRAGTQVVFLYFVDKLASVVRPNKVLAGFARVELAPGESKRVEFRFHGDQTAFVDRDMRWLVEAGETELLMGDSSENLRSAGTVTVTDSRFLEKGRRTYVSESSVTSL